MLVIGLKMLRELVNYFRVYVFERITLLFDQLPVLFEKLCNHMFFLVDWSRVVEIYHCIKFGLAFLEFGSALIEGCVFTVCIGFFSIKHLVIHGVPFMTVKGLKLMFLVGNLL